MRVWVLIWVAWGSLSGQGGVEPSATTPKVHLPGVHFGRTWPSQMAKLKDRPNLGQAIVVMNRDFTRMKRVWKMPNGRSVERFNDEVLVSLDRMMRALCGEE